MPALDCLERELDRPDPDEPREGNYFVAAYPPFSAWRSELVRCVHERMSEPSAAGKRPPLGLYVHLPFCIHRCRYCYYLSSQGRKLAEMQGYAEALIQELALYVAKPALAGRPLGFAYFGGGTPSLLPIRTLERLLQGLQRIMPWDQAAEATFECAPRSVSRAKLQMLHDAGVNRISLGVQQLDDAVLRQNGRVHQVKDIERAWAEVHDAGFDEVNLDLMVGLVGETDRSFHASLDRVLQMGPDRVTLYQLEVPANTPLFRDLRAGLAAHLPTWNCKRRRLAEAFARLEGAGYTIRSAYAAARNRRHGRFVYQEEQYRGADLLGIGASSFSYLAGVHFQNTADTAAYQSCLEHGRLPISRAYVLDRQEQMVREYVLQLKLGQVPFEHFRTRYGVDPGFFFRGALEEHARQGWLTWDSGGASLTRAGLLRVDRLLLDYYLPKHQALRYW